MDRRQVLAGMGALAATPFVTGQWKKGSRHWLPHVALSLFELSALALTDPSIREYHGTHRALHGKRGT